MSDSTTPPAPPDTSAGDGSAVLSDKDKFVLMARKVIFALKYLKAPGAGLMMYGLNDPSATSFKTIHWTEDFCDALDQCGIKIDRDALYALRDGKKAKKSKKPNTVVSGAAEPRTSPPHGSALNDGGQHE